MKGGMGPLTLTLILTLTLRTSEMLPHSPIVLANMWLCENQLLLYTYNLTVIHSQNFHITNFNGTAKKSPLWRKSVV